MPDSLTSLCVLLPCLPPAVDGVGDYTYQLYKHWPERVGFEFLVTSGALESQKLLSSASVRQFSPECRGLMQSLQPIKSDYLLVEYVGYGFDAQSQPFWLPAALRAWKAQDERLKIAVMFHETWASGKPWQKVFWQSHKQRQCAAQMLELADIAVTSGEATAGDLQALGSGKQIHLIPISAGLSTPKPKAKNFRQLLVFGKADTRMRSLHLHTGFLAYLGKNHFLDRIVLAGNAPADSGDLALVNSWKLPFEVATAYNLPMDNLPDLLLESGLSLMQTPSRCLLKSSAFHLAAQLGQVAITKFDGEPGKPLTSSHYLAYRPGRFDGIADFLSSQEKLEQMGAAVLQIAQSQLSWPVIAAAWNNLLKQSLKS